MLLYRPVGLNELRLIYQAGMRAFPPRLPEQPIFYPVLNQPYAEKIARDWNTKSEALAGFVTRFSVEDAYLSRFPRRVVGSREHEELWVPAEELQELNARLSAPPHPAPLTGSATPRPAPIQVIGAFFGEGFRGEVPEQGALAGKSAREQLAALAKMLDHHSSEAAEEIRANHQAVFLNFFFWEQHDFTAEGVEIEARDRALDFVRRSWEHLKSPEQANHAKDRNHLEHTSPGSVPLGVVEGVMGPSR